MHDVKKEICVPGRFDSLLASTESVTYALASASVETRADVHIMALELHQWPVVG